jgi:hypothetical protein
MAAYDQITIEGHVNNTTDKLLNNTATVDPLGAITEMAENNNSESDQVTVIAPTPPPSATPAPSNTPSATPPGQTPGTPTPETPTATLEPGVTPTTTPTGGATPPTATLTPATGTPAVDTPTLTPSVVPSTTPPPTGTPATPTATFSPFLKGDVNGDGYVNSEDAQWILQYAAGKIPQVPYPQNADFNHDGRINSVDAALILQFDAGLLNRMPAGSTGAVPALLAKVARLF